MPNAKTSKSKHAPPDLLGGVVVGTTFANHVYAALADCSKEMGLKEQEIIRLSVSKFLKTEGYLRKV